MFDWWNFWNAILEWAKHHKPPHPKKHKKLKYVTISLKQCKIP